MKQLVVAALILCTFSPVYADSVPQYAREIDANTNSLKELQKTLKEKRVEKEMFLLEEKRIRSELGRIEKNLSALQRQREKLRRQIQSAQKSLATAERELKLACGEVKQWSGAINRESDRWYRSHHSHCRFLSDPIEEKFRLQALERKRANLGDARKKEDSSQQALKRWQAARKNLMNLKAKQDSTAEEQAKVKGQKKKLLNTTVGRRVVAEEEIKKLTESAKALQQLIIRLEQDKKKSEEEADRRRRVQEKKKDLLWPAQGEILAGFGKSKHPELDTYVISNGIKVLSQPGTEVGAVAAGEVIFSGEFRSYGLMAIVDHGGKLYSIYGHLGEIAVEEGQMVKEGEMIGRITRTGQPVLYFEIRSDGQPEDPLLWLKSYTYIKAQ